MDSSVASLHCHIQPIFDQLAGISLNFSRAREAEAKCMPRLPDKSRFQEPGRGVNFFNGSCIDNMWAQDPALLGDERCPVSALEHAKDEHEAH